MEPGHEPGILFEGRGGKERKEEEQKGSVPPCKIPRIER